MLPEKLLTMDELCAKLKERGVDVSDRTVVRCCGEGMEYWHLGNTRKFDFDTSYSFLLRRAKRPRNPAPRRRGRPRAA
jgi:hypothetical protein